ncbi:hypothetical protein AACT_2912 [Arcobacter acticola]|jgi:hypothetical protein|uniref:Uncharacterized protein n=1 Tax=Arcobacter acticola TaxID=1849015 RepID=A0A6M8EPD2_9BACT|nr:hypothetical protein [Arcobacter acticola]QKE29969.1 hypothetical protein AACT_2912 [Arcobacter acticola]
MIERIEKFININEEIYEDYGWCLDLDNLNENNIDNFKAKFINEFSLKCCNDLILEGTDEFELIKRVDNI